MFHCERCGTRFSTGVLSAARPCPRCRARDGVVTMMTWEPLFAARSAAEAARAEARRRSAGRREPEREVAPGPAP